MITNYLKKKILGHSLPQEFACVSLEEITDPLQVTLTIRGSGMALDVTNTHLFLGYKPLIIGIPYAASSTFLESEPEDICLSFHDRLFLSNTVWKGFPTFDKSIARVTLRKSQVLDCGDRTLYLYEGTHARHQFINTFNQFVNRQKEKLRADRKVNINLSQNLADQVQAAYAVPRVISIITLAEGGKMNMFPTDLHGQVNEEFYISSLRHGGKANEQVEKIKSIALSRVDLSWCAQAYTLGKNHMQDLKNSESFPIGEKTSKRLGMSLPEKCLSYHELKCHHAVDIGIHRIRSYKILHWEKLADASTLSHIHRFYAQWRLNNAKPTNFRWR